jgi:hypothetical protein
MQINPSRAKENPGTRAGVERGKSGAERSKLQAFSSSLSAKLLVLMPPSEPLTPL